MASTSGDGSGSGSGSGNSQKNSPSTNRNSERIMSSQVTLNESSPLLSTNIKPSASSSSLSKQTLATSGLQDEEAEFTNPTQFWSKVRAESQWIISSSLSMAAAYLIQFSFAFVSVLTLGHLGAKQLGAGTLAYTTINVIMYAPTIGYACALDTFCTTAFTASSDKRLVGFHMQRGIFATLVHFIIVAPVLWNIEWALLLINQDPEIARLCGQFMKVFIFSTLPWMLFECLKRFIQAQGDMKTSTKILFFIAPLHVVVTYVLVWSGWFGMGFLGAALASCITNWTMFLALFGYICHSDARQAWGGFDWRFIRGISEFYKLAIPSIAMICCDWWAFELLSLEASYLGSDALATQSIIINTICLFFQVPAGIGIAVSTRVGHMLGAGRSKSANLSARVGLTISAIVGVASYIMYLCITPFWAKLYTSDPKILAMFVTAFPIASLTQIFDTINSVNMAVMRATGRQRLASAISLPSYYVLMFPLGVYLAFCKPFEWSVSGLWVGMNIGLSIVTIAQFLFILGYLDWDFEVIACLKRLQKSGPDGDSQQRRENQDPIITIESPQD
ncbi:ethionine resistance protein [Mycoemilia scoparia]|uniref:Ethionine resistance protein n=1 Tax=Mycoemilia scoparia TaxID=417184 RepID=A0A9W7ZUQ7_9FUNG|nr:ethionine resistance protein [Mycoemilia scoparia]